MDIFLCLALFISFFAMVFMGNAAACSSAILDAVFGAVENVIGMLGAIAFFSGITEILKRAGLVNKIERALRSVTEKLLGSETSREVKADAIMNYALNLLGLGNAATPYGLRAMEGMKREDGALSEAMLAFLLLNLSAVQLLPVTLIALRSSSGSAFAEAILLPVLISTFFSTLLAIAVIFLRRKLLPKRESRL